MLTTDKEIQQYLNSIDACGPDAAVLEHQLREQAGLDECPECKQWTVRSKYSGVECENPDCDFWFCY